MLEMLAVRMPRVTCKDAFENIISYLKQGVERVVLLRTELPHQSCRNLGNVTSSMTQ